MDIVRGSSGGGGFDRRRLTWQDIDKWEARHQRLSLYDIDALLAIDMAPAENALKEDPDG